MIIYTVFLNSDDKEHILITSDYLSPDVICEQLNIQEKDVVGIDIQVKR